MVDAAKIMRSPIVRCVLGSQTDRRPDINTHIDETIKVLKNMRSRIMDANVKVAIENHAGDMQARELKRLIEGAGKEFVGVCIDSGNAVWTIEDPHLTLETLAPYVLTSHMRDSYVFVSPRGTEVQWQRMGDGNIGMEDYIRKYVQQCPGAPVSLEVIVSGTPRTFNYRDPAAWELFKTTPASEFARFLALCEKGVPRPVPAAGAGRGQGGGAAAPAATQAAGAGAGPGRGAAGAPSGCGRGRGRCGSPGRRAWRRWRRARWPAESRSGAPQSIGRRRVADLDRRRARAAVTRNSRASSLVRPGKRACSFVRAGSERRAFHPSSSRPAATSVAQGVSLVRSRQSLCGLKERTNDIR